MIYLTVGIGVAVILLLTLPFWIGPGGLLQASSSIKSPDTLKALKEAILRQYIEDERSYSAGALSARVWRQRQSYLANRYIDAARRLDFLAHLGRKETDRA